MRTRAYAVVAAAAATFGFTASARGDAVTDTYLSYLADHYGKRNPAYAECPRVERFNGMALCTAEFRQHGRWRYESVTLKGAHVSDRFTRTWVRKVRTCKRNNFAPGHFTTNLWYCDYLMAGDVQRQKKFTGRYPKRAVLHGTNRAGFEEVAVFNCKRKGAGVRCVNALGDAFTYTAA